MRLLVSACLLGVCCRYDGGGKPCQQVMRLLDAHTLIPVCPEQLGGLPTPRVPAERQGSRVISRSGQDVTAAYEKGAEEALRLYRLMRCDAAILKARSPSCGCGTIYDGTFSHTVIPGDGVTAEALRAEGLALYGESDIGKLL